MRCKKEIVSAQFTGNFKAHKSESGGGDLNLVNRLKPSVKLQRTAFCMFKRPGDITECFFPFPTCR